MNLKVGFHSIKFWEKFVTCSCYKHLRTLEVGCVINIVLKFLYKIILKISYNTIYDLI